MAGPEFSLYLHIPFCSEKCDYCDFYSLPLGHSATAFSAACFKNRYLDALLTETERRLNEIKAESGVSVYVPTIYIGGGTPSLVGAPGITRLLEGLSSLAGAPREITVEANPETADSAFLKACALNGVTRLSLGIQSFDEAPLQAVGRFRTSRRAALDRTLAEAAEMFGGGLSLDLMSGLPGQNETTVLHDIEKALSYKPGHISLYALAVEEGTLLARRLTRNAAEHERDGGALCSRAERLVQLPCEETAETLWLTGRDALKQAGYEHYEVSNFALSSATRSLHNIRYWQMRNWLGIGPAASGTIINDTGRGRRQSYVPDTEGFCSAVQNRRVPPLSVEELDLGIVLKETLLMGYRYCEGPDPVLFARRFGKTIDETIPKTLDRWRNNHGDIPGQQTDYENFSMNETIMNFLNRFLLDAFRELDAAQERGLASSI